MKKSNKKGKEKEVVRLEADKGVVFVKEKVLKNGSEVFIEYNSKNIIPAIFLGFNPMRNLYEFERQSTTFPKERVKVRMREMQLNERKVYVLL